MAAESRTPTLPDVLTDTPRLSAQAWRRLDWPRRYLLAVRAAVLPLTVFCGLFGGLLALPWTPAEGWRLTLVTAALVLGHATANLVNDQMEWLARLGREGRVALPPDAGPLARGLMHPLTHTTMLAVTGAGALLLALAVCSVAGPPAYWLVGIGTMALIFYAWPLKRWGLGELVVLVVWGPLAVGGAYWVVSGDWGPEIGVLSLIFGLGPAVAVLGRHADQRRDDAARGVGTLAVRLGPAGGPRLMAALALLQTGAGLTWVWLTGDWAYLTLLAALPALASLLHVCLRRRPTARPGDYPAALWPSWYGVAGFRFARAAGGALAAGALLAGI